jgi:hypothetical protein
MGCICDSCDEEVEETFDCDGEEICQECCDAYAWAEDNIDDDDYWEES